MPPVESKGAFWLFSWLVVFEQKLPDAYMAYYLVCECVCQHPVSRDLHGCLISTADLPNQSNKAMAFRLMSGLINRLYHR